MSVTAPWRARASVAIIGLLSPVLYFYRAVFSDEIFIARDIQRVYYPLRHYWAERVLQGEFPQWYPFDAAGQPFVGMVISGAFHPSNLLYLLLPLGSALKWNVLACYPVAFGGAYLCARRLDVDRAAAVLAAIAWAYCGYMVCITNNLLYLMAAATFPWALWACDRFFAQASARRAFPAALLTALVLLAGDSQSFAVCGVFVVALAAVRHRQPGDRVRRFGATVALLGWTAALTMVQLLPAFTVLENARPGASGPGAAQTWSLHPVRLLELLLGPLVYVPPVEPGGEGLTQHLLAAESRTNWVDSVHLGAAVLVLAIAASVHYRRHFHAQLAAVGVLGMTALAMGRHAALYRMFYDLVPLWRPFRYPEKLLPWLLFLLCMFAAVGAAACRRDPVFRRRVGLATLVFAAVLGVGALAEGFGRAASGGLLELVWEGGPDPSAFEHLHRNTATAFTASFVVLALLGVGLVWVRDEVLRSALPPLLVFLHLLATGTGLPQLTRPELLTVPPAFVSAILSLEPSPTLGALRVASGTPRYVFEARPGMTEADQLAGAMAMSLEPDSPAVWGLESSGKYLPAASVRMTGLMEARAWWLARGLALANVRYLTMDKAAFARQRGRADVVVAEHPGFSLLLLRNPTTLPRARLASPRCVSGAAESLRAVVAKDLDPRTAIVECAGPLEPAPEDTDLGTATVSRYLPERVEIDAEVRERAVLVLADAYYSGWSATVDAAAAEIFPTNHGFRGVALNPGAHRIVFTFRDPLLKIGAAISAAALLIGLLVLLGPRRRAAQTRHSAPAEAR